MLKKDSKKNLLDHSEAKVRLLGVYINKYLNIISNDGCTQKIRIYDLFCGEGVYDNGGYGSPVVVMKAVKDCYYSFLSRNKRIPKIDVLLNDLNSEKVEKTKKFLAEKSYLNKEIVSVDFRSEDYKKLLKETTKEIAGIKNEKAFVEIVPYKDWKKSGNVWSFINELKEGFQSKVPEFFVDTFTVQKDSSTVFCLFFFTSHIKGFEKMLESKWDIDTESGKGWNYSPQLGLFGGQETNKLALALEEYLTTENRSNADVFEFILRLGFLPKHANEVLDSWQKELKLDVILANGEKARKKSFYLNYKNYRDNPNKVTLHLSNGTIKYRMD